MSDKKGYDRLWAWFGCSRASFMTIPRVMMHEMPDEWQDKMAELLEQYDQAFDQSKVGVDEVIVSAKLSNRFVKMPEWILNYRRPDKKAISYLKYD